MKSITKGKNMNNFKKIGLTALAGSLTAISAQAAEMSVSGASVLTYTGRDASEVAGNPFGMKTNLSFTASGEVNGYTVSYMQTSKDQFAGMSSARLSVDMGDMGTIAFDQGSGSGLATLDDKTPTAAEEVWDGLDASAATTNVPARGRVGAAGSSGVFNYVQTYNDVKLNAAMRKGSGTANADGGTSGAGHSTSWDFALSSASISGVDGLELGGGYGEKAALKNGNADEHQTFFANYSMGMVTLGGQLSAINKADGTETDEQTEAWGIAVNINDNLSVSYGSRDTEYKKSSSTHVTENISGIAAAYTMGSIKIAGNINDVDNNNGTIASKDENMEIAVSFAF
jgi:outer membrane protein OmpU